MAKSEASVSTPKGASLSVAHTTDCAMSFFRFSNAAWGSLDIGKVGCHCERSFLLRVALNPW